MPESIPELLATEAAIEKLGACSIATDEAGQLPRNDHVVVRNPSDPTGAGKRRRLVGRTDGGRTLTLVIERTIDPSTWLFVTGWNSTSAESTCRVRPMSTDPWTSDDPQPGDFDAVLESIDADAVEHRAGDPDATLRILVSVDGDDARRLQRLAETHGKTPHDVVADLLRDADRSAA